MTDKFIERRIITGLIVSTDYIQRVRKIWESRFINSKTAILLAGWCLDFYDKYGKAPGKEIEAIFENKAKKLEDKDAEDIEDILNGLSDEYEHAEKFNVDYLYDQTVARFEEVGLDELAENIKDYVDKGDLTNAKKAALEFTLPVHSTSTDVELSDKEELQSALSRAFTTAREPVVRYPRQLGKFWNNQLVRGAFVALMAPEKRGKTFFLLDMAIRAVRQGAKVAFFQAGDMNQDEQIMRVANYLTKKSEMKKHSGIMYEPVRDCWKNQIDECNLKVRESDFGPFDDKTKDQVRHINMENLIEAYQDNEDYRPCYNCAKYWDRDYGAVWLQKVDTGEPLELAEAQRVCNKFFEHRRRSFRMSSHPNGTLKVSDMEAILDIWEREDGFVPDMIIDDYVDINAPDIKADFRQQENDKWKRLRGLSAKRHALVLTVTQTDADSYNKNLLDLRNFSEDKRKFAHVTAMYGLNQDKAGREKDIGIIRINEIVVRSDSFSKGHQVHVLQNLRRGQPSLSSYW